MLVSEFIRKKNEILFKHTGLILVPEAQIKECKKVHLDMGDRYADSDICPYCKVFASTCLKCPMAKADNRCGASDSTYRELRRHDKCNYSICSESTPWYDELKKLVDTYNRELKPNTKIKG